MRLVRYVAEGSPDAEVGVELMDGIRKIEVGTAAALLALPLTDIRSAVESAAAGPVVSGNAVLLPPVDGRTEIWAAGVTYSRSRQARMEESATADVYDLVYDSERPELFFKCAAWRAVTDGEPIGIRADSALNVPEPELAVVANRHGEVVGYTVCDDVSSRSIEGENPLYLPQAKIYAGACALASGIRLAWEVANPAALGVELIVERAGAVAWRGTTSTAQLRRAIADLLRYLFAAEQFPDGAVLSTGTGIVPEMDFTLREGDKVTIRIDQVGSLTNVVAVGQGHFSWLRSGDGNRHRRLPR